MEKTFTLKKKIFRSLLVLFGVAVFLGLSYLLLVYTGLWDKVNTPEKIKNLILQMGFYGRSIFLLLQCLQVTFLPLPASAVVIAGTLVYGPLEAALLSFAGILLGSVIAFWLGKTFGQKLASFMVGKEAAAKARKTLEKGKFCYVLMMILPFFPDDVLCLVAGLTDMSWRFFVITQVLTRPIGILLTAYFSSGSIIPFHGWGIAVWIAIAVLSIVAIVVLWKIQNKPLANIGRRDMVGKEQDCWVYVRRGDD